MCYFCRSIRQFYPTRFFFSHISSARVELDHQSKGEVLSKMLPQGMKKVIADNPKKLAELIDLVNLPSTLREFMGQSRSSRLGCFKHVWSYIKENNLQDPNNKNVVNCDENLKRILLGKAQVDLVELPMLIKLHFPRQQR